jgi:glycine hydroxymethyltransferase
VNSKIFSLIAQERSRQEDCIDLIASENYASSDVLAATGSILTNKYAEGYPGKRYYGGCTIVDQIETMAIDLGKKLFNTEHMNVQPHSGSSANMAVYFSQLKPGDTVLGMNLAAGGHLTHGHKVNFSGKLYNFIHYGVDPETELIDYKQVTELAAEHKPKMIIAGASAYSQLIDYPQLAAIARENQALLMVDMAHIAGLVAADIIPSPMPHADIVTSTTHKTLRGPRGGIICSTAAFAQSIDRATMPGSQGGPLMHIIAAKAIAFEEAMQPAFKHYQIQVIKNAQAMAQAFKNLGYRIVSGGTSNHLMLVDLRSVQNRFGEKITGKLVEELLENCNIVLNRNGIPFDPENPVVTSGIRVGTPAITTRGMTEQDTVQIVHWIDEAIAKRNDEHFLRALTAEVTTFCKKFPLP